MRSGEGGAYNSSRYNIINPVIGCKHALHCNMTFKFIDFGPV